MFNFIDYKLIASSIRNRKVVDVNGNGEDLEITFNDGTVLQVSCKNDFIYTEIF
ncbi:MAG: hypothetical protein ACOCUI_00805 [bacterium]